MNPEATYRVGLNGSTGKGDYGHQVDVAFTKAPDVEIVAVADEDPRGRAQATQRTGALQSYASYREMLARERLDIVGICPRWVDQHQTMLLAAAEAGCHVYMEKPFCRSLTEADEVVNQFDMRHLKLGIGHISQYSPVIDTILSIIQAGEIGELLELRGRGKEDRRGGYLAPATILRDSSWSPGRTGKSWEPISSAGIGLPEPRTDGNYEGGHVAAITDLINSIEQQRPTRCGAEDGRAIVEMTI